MKYQSYRAFAKFDDNYYLSIGKSTNLRSLQKLVKNQEWPNFVTIVIDGQYISENGSMWWSTIKQYHPKG